MNASFGARHFSKREKCLAPILVWGMLSVMALGSAEAAVSPRAPAAIRRLAIQHNGRLKPFDSFARETLERITGSAQRGGEDPVATVLQMLASPEPWQAKPLIAVPFHPLRGPLGLGPQTASVSYNDLVASKKLMRMLPVIVEKQRQDEKLSMLDNETMDVFERFVAFSNLSEQRLWLVPPPPGSLEREWQSILDPAGYAPPQQQALKSAWTVLLAAVRQGQPQAIDASATGLAEALRAANPAAYPPAWRLELEVFYNHAAPFHIARLLYLLAVVSLLWALVKPGRAGSLGLSACGTAFAVHGAGILMRVVIGGRPPVSNFFETMLWLPFVGVLIALVFERIYLPAPRLRQAGRANYFALGASILAVIALVLADYVPLDPGVSPVVAVLRSNLWLTVHVLTVVASYGALALATVLAHIYSVQYLLARRGRRQALEALDTFLYRVIQVGVVLLAGGIMLGAVWANASWGRYWGWDPKETWALITLLWYLAVLHGRFAEWLSGIGVALATIGGFLLLLMTYYGVSFYLVGLHSYAGGHAKPLPVLLVAYLAAEAAFLLVVGLAALRRRAAS